MMLQSQYNNIADFFYNHQNAMHDVKPSAVSCMCLRNYLPSISYII